MRGERLRRLYAAGVAAVFAAVAVWRLDLVFGAWQATAWSLAQGGAARWKVLGEIFFLTAILAATWAAIPLRPRPAHDAAVLLLGGLCGAAAETWGTRLGLWRDDTAERPPLWIVPVWPLGAALVERLAARAREFAGPAPAALYWMLAAAVAGICLWFSAPWFGQPASWAVLAGLGAALAVGVKPEEDFWTLAVGIICVFFADLWGTTNGCWAYYLQHGPWGVWKGISFGMCFDAAIVVGCLRLARALRR